LVADIDDPRFGTARQENAFDGAHVIVSVAKVAGEGNERPSAHDEAP
jgi:hypothetical protein